MRLTNPKHGGVRSMRLPLPNQAEIYQRLAAYEDSGLPPEQVQELAKAKADGRGKVVHGKVVHGKWISEEICSACNFDICDMLSGDLEGVRFETPDYCPNCGAKMDGEAAEKALQEVGE